MDFFKVVGTESMDDGLVRPTNEGAERLEQVRVVFALESYFLLLDWRHLTPGFEEAVLRHSLSFGKLLHFHNSGQSSCNIDQTNWQLSGLLVLFSWCANRNLLWYTVAGSTTCFPISVTCCKAQNATK